MKVQVEATLYRPQGVHQRQTFGAGLTDDASQILILREKFDKTVFKSSLLMLFNQIQIKKNMTMRQLHFW